MAGFHGGLGDFGRLESALSRCDKDEGILVERAPFAPIKYIRVGVSRKRVGGVWPVLERADGGQITPQPDHSPVHGKIMECLGNVVGSHRGTQYAAAES